VALDLAGTVPLAETLWYDLARWPGWVDGFAAVARREGDWPAEGSTVVWDSRPGGRGRVLERSVRHAPGSGQTVQVEDEQLRGTQEVSFAALADGVEVALELTYELKSGGPLRQVVDLLFIRRALGDSLRRTLVRFGNELAADGEEQPIL
jgi:hypothetical protein